MDTLASMRASVIQWLRGSRVDDSQIDDAINDAVDSLFTTLLRASMSVLMGGPVNLTLDASSDGVNIISIADPTVAPTVTDVVSGALAEHTVVAGYTLATESGTETLISPATSHVVAVNNVAQVAAPAFVAGAIGWNMYCGSASTRLAKQNEEPIPFGVNFIEDDSGITNNPDDPVPPTQNTTADNIFYIRHLEHQTPDGNWTPWNQGDLDSLMMRRLGRTIPGRSDYFTYGWDLINQHQLEVRPALGAQMTTRMFFIVKPRRMRFNNSPLPFPTVPSTEFFRNFALSLIFLSLREINLATAWEKKADTARARCELALTFSNRPRNARVTPYRC